MPDSQRHDDRKAKRMLDRYNMVPNMFWSILGLTPISVYCFTRMEPWTAIVFLLVSLLPLLWRKAFLDTLQIGKTKKIYERLGVPLINRIAQNGTLVKSLIRKKYPGYKGDVNNRSSIGKLISQTYMFERFHLILFLVFILVTIHALLYGRWFWVFVLTVTNIIYNVYPNLLQQYVRIRLRAFVQ